MLDLVSASDFVNCHVYWWAIIIPRRYLRASDRIDSMLSVMKFWNSSIYRKKSVLWLLSSISCLLIAAICILDTRISQSRLAFTSQRTHFDRLIRRILPFCIISNTSKELLTCQIILRIIVLVVNPQNLAAQNGIISHFSLSHILANVWFHQDFTIGFFTVLILSF